MEEADRVGISAVLAADAELDVGAAPTAAVHGGSHQLTHAGLVDASQTAISSTIFSST